MFVHSKPWSLGARLAQNLARCGAQFAGESGYLGASGALRSGQTWPVGVCNLGLPRP
jgi:hypothetical protein